MTDNPFLEIDIGKLVMKTRSRVDRLAKISKMIEKESDLERKELIMNTLGKNEIRMCHEVGEAIKIRVSEVVKYMTEKLMLDNVTEELVLENPWMVCCAAGYQWDRINMLLQAKDAANGDFNE